MTGREEKCREKDGLWAPPKRKRDRETLLRDRFAVKICKTTAVSFNTLSRRDRKDF